MVILIVIYKAFQMHWRDEMLLDIIQIYGKFPHRGTLASLVKEAKKSWKIVKDSSF